MKYREQKTFYFEIINIYSIKINYLKLLKKIATMCQSQKTIRKIIVYEKENIYFQEFWPQVVNLQRTFIFLSEQAFSEHLLPTACEYSMFLPLTKIKNENIKVTGDKKYVLNLKSKSKLVKLLCKSCSFHKLYVLKSKFQNFPLFHLFL